METEKGLSLSEFAVVHLDQIKLHYGEYIFKRVIRDLERKLPPKTKITAAHVVAMLNAFVKGYVTDPNSFLDLYYEYRRTTTRSRARRMARRQAIWIKRESAIDLDYVITASNAMAAHMERNVSYDRLMENYELRQRMIERLRAWQERIIMGEEEVRNAEPPW